MSKGLEQYSLWDLKRAIDIATADGMNPDNIPVLINLAEPSVGAGASTGVTYAGMSFDWEHGQFRITPAKPLVGKGKTLDDVKPAIAEEAMGNRNSYWCPQCGGRVNKPDHFCKSCGQRFR